MSEPACVRLATMAMRCRFELVLFGDDELWLRSAGEAAIEEIEDTHAELTRFERDSVVSRINRGGRQFVDADVFDLLSLAERVREESHGAFDLRMGGRGNVELDDHARSVEVTNGAQLDLGGIAKGFAVDRAIAALWDAGIENAFVHGGTSSAAGIGCGPDGEPWRVRLFDDDGPKVSLIDQALSVSGEEHQPGHLVDPRTGQERRAPISEACVGATAAAGDAWSTAIAVHGEGPLEPPSVLTVFRWRAAEEGAAVLGAVKPAEWGMGAPVSVGVERVDSEEHRSPVSRAMGGCVRVAN